MAILDLIPVIGSTVGGFIVTLVALTVSLPVAIATLAFYIVYRLAEDYLIVPRIMGRTVEVPAVVSLVAVLLGGVLLGIVGALVAIPVAAAHPGDPERGHVPADGQGLSGQAAPSRSMTGARAAMYGACTVR